MKTKILISIGTLILSSILGIILLNTFAGINLPLDDVDSRWIIAFEIVMAMGSPIFIYSPSYCGLWEPILKLPLVVGTLVWLIYLTRFGKKKWMVVFPVLIWVCIGTWNTLLIMYSQ